MRVLEDERQLTAIRAEIAPVLTRPPAPEQGARQLAAILAEAQRVTALDPDRATADLGPARPERRRAVLRGRFALLRFAGVVLAAGVLTCAGLALAGVRPPEPVSDLLEAVGADVPGSDREPAPAEAEPAPGLRPDDSRDRSGDRGETGGDASAERAGAEKPGRRRAEERNQGRRGEQASAEGRQTAEEAREGGGPPEEPGRSEDHGASAPGPPSSPGNSAAAPQGPPPAADTGSSGAPGPPPGAG